MTLSVQAYHHEDVFESLSFVWNDLLHRSASDSLFLTVEFQRIWWKHLGRGELLVITVTDDDELIGIAPLFIEKDENDRRVLNFVGCVEVADYLDLIALQGREREVTEALVGHLARLDDDAWHALDLCNVHQGSPTLDLLPELAKAKGWDVDTELDDVCPIVDLPETWDEYLGMLDGKQRHEIRRRLRRANAWQGMEWYIVDSEHDLEAEIDDFLHVMAVGDPEKQAFLTDSMDAFFRELARTAFDAGWLQLAFLTIDGQKAAAYFNFVYNNQVLAYNSGLDWESFPKVGAGTILTSYLIRHAIEEGREVFDFMRGDEEYKYRFGGEDIEVRRLTVERT